ncbi:MAG TPA: ABC transporter permease [Dehalococcoidia bacterium]|jgi:oligopeptide transport system permease protein|nr:ABC transporter permease [Dehalococcoidia bacterium]
MTAYIIRRVLWLIPVLWAVATITFFLMHAVPGGPFTQDRDLPAQVMLALNRRYHLDQPLWKQYLSYFWDIFVHQDLGLSFRGDRDVSYLIKHGFFVTAQLGTLAFLVALTWGIFLGVISALNRNGFLDYIGVFFATVGASVPSFIAGVFLIIVFAVNLHWFDFVGWGGPVDWGDTFHLSAWEPRKMVLPVIALSLLPSAYIARITRASMLEVLGQDYIRTANAKGLAFYVVILRHALKNSMIPVLTVLGPIFAALVTGSFIVESMFSIPGIGRSFVQAVTSRDYGMIMGTTLFYAGIVAAMNLLVDIAYAVVDPRIRYS